MTRIYQLITLVFTSVFSILVFLAFTSCNHTKQVDTKYIYTERIDTLTINGKTEYITRIDSVRIDCPEQPKTRKELRHERKSWHHEYKMLKEKNAFTIDSLNKVIKLSRIQRNVRKIESKQVIKQTKAINQKALKWYHWVLISIGGIILLFIGFMVGKFLRL